MKRKLVVHGSLISLLMLSGMLLYAQNTNPEQPQYRLYHDLIYHDSTNQVYLFGGLPSHGWDGEFDDVWSFDPGNKRWTKICKNEALIYVDSIGTRNEVPAHGPAWDRESNRIIFFNRSKSTRAFHPETRTWELMSPEVTPLERCGQSSVYDAESDRIILFGGFECKSLISPFYNDVWAYDYNSDTWEEMDPVVVPRERAYASMVYNPVSDRVMMWGGRQLNNAQSSFYDNSWWEYDYNNDTWTEIVNTDGPSLPYSYAEMVYHPGNNEVLMFGGGPMDQAYNGYNRDESWIYSCSDPSWTRIATVNTPPKTSNHSMVYLPGTNDVVMFGGETGNLMYSDDLLKGTWYYDYANKSWRETVFAYAGQDDHCATDMEQIILGGSPSAWGGVEPYNYAWSGTGLLNGKSYSATDFLESTGAANPVLTTQVDPFTLFLEVSDAMGSIARDTVHFQFLSLDVCMDNWQASIIEGDSVQLAHCIEGGSEPYVYQWLPAEDLSDPNVSEPWAHPATTTTVELVATDNAGCEMQSEFTIYVRGVSVELNPAEGSLVTIFSNPSTRQIRILADNIGLEPLSLQILNINGAIMDQVTIHPGSSERNLATYTPGIYLYRLTNHNALVGSGKFIVY